MAQQSPPDLLSTSQPSILSQERHCTRTNVPKNKAPLIKARPISPYTHHPWKVRLGQAAKLLHWLLVVVDHFSFAIFDTNDLKQFVSHANERIEELRVDGYTVDPKLKMTDISNMFTELTHSEICIALRWVLSLASKQLRRSEVSVPLRDLANNCIREGIAYNDYFICFSFEQL